MAEKNKVSILLCVGFESQTWRPDKCLNCFMPRASHAADKRGDAPVAAAIPTIRPAPWRPKAPRPLPPADATLPTPPSSPVKVPPPVSPRTWRKSMDVGGSGGGSAASLSPSSLLPPTFVPGSHVGHPRHEHHVPLASHPSSTTSSTSTSTTSNSTTATTAATTTATSAAVAVTAGTTGTPSDTALLPALVMGVPDVLGQGSAPVAVVVRSASPAPTAIASFNNTTGSSTSANTNTTTTTTTMNTTTNPSLNVPDASSFGDDAGDSFQTPLSSPADPEDDEDAVKVVALSSSTVTTTTTTTTTSSSASLTVVSASHAHGAHHADHHDHHDHHTHAAPPALVVGGSHPDSAPIVEVFVVPSSPLDGHASSGGGVSGASDAAGAAVPVAAVVVASTIGVTYTSSLGNPTVDPSDWRAELTREARDSNISTIETLLKRNSRIPNPTERASLLECDCFMHASTLDDYEGMILNKQSELLQECVQAAGSIGTGPWKRRESFQAATATGSLKTVALVEIGKVLKQKMENYEEYYTRGSLLGGGSFGRVYKCSPRHSTEGHEVAIKIIPTAKLVDEQAREELRREVQMLWAVRDEPFVMRVLGVFETHTEIAIATELCQGDLYSVLPSVTTERHAAEVFLQMIQAVLRCHSLGIIHRDIKPANFFVGLDGTLRLGDFGLAVHASNLTVTGTYEEFGRLLGSGIYAAPECYSRHFSHKSDIWACGIIFFVLLNGTEPFSNVYDACNTPLDTFWLEGKCSKEAIDLVKKMLEKDPEQRIDGPGVLSHPWTRGQHGDAPLEDAILEKLKKYGRLDAIKKGLLKLVSMSLSPDKIVSAGALFQKIDLDHSQQISLGEFVKVFKDRGVPEAETASVVATIDLDGDASIDYDEFITAAISQNLLNQEEALRVTFRRMDTNNDGKLSRAEFLSSLSFLSLPQEAIDAFISRYDKDGNGEIDYNEFVAMTSMAQ